MKFLFDNIYKDKSVFITGHTGFKGSWLSLWLTKLGSQVTGYARKPDTIPNHFSNLDLHINSLIGDLLDFDRLADSMKQAMPEIVFHLAAQPLVRESYKYPQETYSTNVLGTLNVLEAARKTPSVQAVVVVTTDKVYENFEHNRCYSESERLGGYDPYSSSKACVEILCASYRNSFWNLEEYGKDHNVLLSTVRAGNVIGGGDWSKDRLIPDIVKAASQGKTAVIRNPQSTRPWQHVLDCLSGYLLTGKLLLEGKNEVADCFNFGPAESDALTVKTICNYVKACWPETQFDFPELKEQPHEAGLLRLDSSKARRVLNWEPVWDSGRAIESTINWYRSFYESGTVLSEADLEHYIKDAQHKGIVWTKQSMQPQ